MKKIVLIFLYSTLSFVAYSHPVVFKGGWVYQGSFMPQMNEMKVGYTFDPKWAIVANSHRFEGIDNYQDYTIGLNFLAKRWLSHDSQGNIYLGAHLGQYKDDLGEGSSSHVFFMADWEDREDYVVFKTKKYFYNGIENQDYMFRYGFAPYVAGMNELQSWLIVQTYYNELQSKELLVIPMLRFFYKNVLWEMGSSTRGDSFLTLMVHY